MTENALPLGTTARLDALASALYGEDWPRQIATLTGVNLRTCQRIKAAAIAGEEARSSYGVLLGVSARMIGLIREAEMLNDALTSATLHDHL